MALAPRLLGCLNLLAAAWTAPNAATAQVPDYVERNNKQIEQACIITGACDSRPNPRPQAPPKPDVWGAIAISPTLGWGTSWNYTSEAAAKVAALERCRNSNAGAACKIVVSVADVCVSLAISSADKIYSVGGPIGAANYAEDGAKLRCQRAGGKACAVAASLCADGLRHVVGGDTVWSNGNPIHVGPGQSPAPGRH